MTIPKTNQRRQVEAALSSAFREKLGALPFEPDPLGIVKSLLNLAFDVADAAEIPRQVLALKIHKVAKKRLPRLKNGAPTWTMPEAKA